MQLSTGSEQATNLETPIGTFRDFSSPSAVSKKNYMLTATTTEGLHFPLT
jgi:hypothetical protein